MLTETSLAVEREVQCLQFCRARALEDLVLLSGPFYTSRRRPRLSQGPARGPQQDLLVAREQAPWPPLV